MNAQIADDKHPCPNCVQLAKAFKSYRCAICGGGSQIADHKLTPDLQAAAYGYADDLKNDVVDLTEGFSMSAKEQKEHSRLLRLWATGKATRQQMLRCTELSRKATHG